MNVLVFPTPTGYRLTSSRFSLLDWGIFNIFSSEMIGSFSRSLEFRPVISQIQPVHLEPVLPVHCCQDVTRASIHCF